MTKETGKLNLIEMLRRELGFDGLDAEAEGLLAFIGLKPEMAIDDLVDYAEREKRLAVTEISFALETPEFQDFSLVAEMLRIAGMDEGELEELKRLPGGVLVADAREVIRRIVRDIDNCGSI